MILLFLDTQVIHICHKKSEMKKIFSMIPSFSGIIIYIYIYIHTHTHTYIHTHTHTHTQNEIILHFQFGIQLDSYKNTSSLKGQVPENLALYPPFSCSLNLFPSILVIRSSEKMTKG